jgi:RNA-directed DNA polymerase
VVAATGVIVVNGPEDNPDAGTYLRWRDAEDNVARLGQRIFKATQAGDFKKVRNLQKLTAPRGALSYPRLQPGGTRREVPGSDG